MPDDLEPSTPALLREFVAALPQMPVQGSLEPWRYFTDRETAPPGEHMDMLDLGERSLILGWGEDELRPAEGRLIATVASPPVVLALADLLEHLKALGRDHATLDRTDLDAYIADTLAATRALDAALRRSQP